MCVCVCVILAGESKWGFGDYGLIRGRFFSTSCHGRGVDNMLWELCGPLMRWGNLGGAGGGR